MGGVAAQYVTFLETCKEKFRAAANTSGRFAAYPVDTLRFRMQCEMREGGAAGVPLMQQTARKMWAQGGMRTFYRGLFWGLVGQYPYSAIDLTTFEYTKRWWIRRMERKRFVGPEVHPSAAMTAAFGGFSGGLGASLVWPLNLLRTRLQTDRTLHPRQYDGIADVARQTVAAEGWRSLFKGITPNLVKVVPSVAITYTVWEKAKQVMGLE